METNRSSLSRGETLLGERRSFPILKTVVLGAYRSPAHYRHNLILKSDEFYSTDRALSVLEKITVSQVQLKLNLVAVTAADLGWNNKVNYNRICSLADSFGLDRCPAEVGPALRLQYSNQPYFEYLQIAMDPVTIITNCDSPQIFGVNRDNSVLLLDSNYCGPESFWNANRRWVFVAPR